MDQNTLNREVARQTGESISTIKRLGFFLDGPFVDDDPVELAPQVVDFDVVDVQRRRVRNSDVAHV